MRLPHVCMPPHAAYVHKAENLIYCFNTPQNRSGERKCVPDPNICKEKQRKALHSPATYYITTDTKT